MRVFQVAPPWIEVPPSTYGGTETMLDTLCRALSRRGHQVALFAPTGSTCPVETVASGHAASGTKGRTAAAELRHVRAAYEAAHRWGAEVVHDHTVLGPAVGAPGAGVPVVTTVHDPLEGDVADAARHIARACAVIAISHAQAAADPSVAVAAMIHHGVDPDTGPPFDRRPEDPLVFLGRLSPDKGVDTAVAVARLTGRELVIAGKCRDPEEEEFFTEVIAPELDDRVHYVGEVDAAGKRVLLGRARCLLNPIRWPEPFGMVMIEALAVGTPVVATPRGAAPEIVADGITGYLAEDVTGLAAAVEQVDEIHAEACRRHVVEHFSAERMATDHEALYEKVRSQFRPPSEGKAA